MFTLLVVAALLGESPNAGAEVTPDYSRVIASGLHFLDNGGAKLEKGASCVNCHHAPLRNWALWEASRAGVKVDVAALRAANETQVARVQELKDDYRDKQWGHSLSAFYLVAVDGSQRMIEAVPATELAKLIVEEQDPSGQWKAAGQFAKQRRPAKDADEAQTLWTVLALASKLDRADAKAAHEKALRWLAETKPGATIDSRALRLAIEHRFGQPERRDTLLKEFLATQRADGGWGWQADDPSEAWPTGLALFALGTLGEKTPAAEVQRARTFLAQSQTDDGSWLVQGKLTKDHKMASYFGTAWAVIGLCRTREVK